MAARGGTSTSPAWSGASASGPGKTLVRRLVASALLLAAVLFVGYAAFSVYAAGRIVYDTPLALTSTPADYGLKYTSVTFPSREDHIQLSGWFIPGLLPGGKLTTQRVIIMVHGAHQNRADPAAGVLDVGRELVFNGFAVLLFDMRGEGISPPAPFSLGIYEQRDALGAVDFIHNGRLPYPELGRPKVIGGWGVSMGAATLIFAGAQEKSIAAFVLDCPFAYGSPFYERGIPQAGFPAFFTPGALVATKLLYGIDLYNDHPVDYIAKLAPRPLLLIHGLADKYTPPFNHYQLMRAALSASNANVQEWLVPDADHAQSFHTLRTQYVQKIVAFFNAGLGPDTSAG
jgi:fermentation-respiration switch protein FrsA (DUF1100 family)